MQHSECKCEYHWVVLVIEVGYLGSASTVFREKNKGEKCREEASIRQKDLAVNCSFFRCKFFTIKVCKVFAFANGVRWQCPTSAVKQYETKLVSQEWLFDSTICSGISVSKSKPSVATDRSSCLPHTSLYIRTQAGGWVSSKNFVIDLTDE